jgi:death-on-curing family protein
LFASTWFSLDAFDKGTLTVKKVSKKKVDLLAGELSVAILELKRELISRDEATGLFATDRHHSSVEGIVGNVMQSFSGKHVYESAEEKAAHLLYFIVKNHPFVDGNKRTGAFSFIWFLNKNNMLKKDVLTPNSLTALTLLVAESKPEHKENVIKLLIKLIES